MNGTSNWLDAWKTRAENRRQMLAQMLNRKPASARAQTLRDQYLKQVQNALSTRQSWADAYAKHVKEMHSIVANPSASSSSVSGPKSGSLGGS